VDAAADHDAALADRAKRGRHQRADRGEEDRRVELSRRELGRVARPGGAERAGEALSRGVTGAGEGVELAAAMDGDLGDDVGRRAEAIEAEALDGVAAHPQGAVADEPAQSRGAASRSPKPAGSRKQ